jgi:hypothetical protein
MIDNRSNSVRYRFESADAKIEILESAVGRCLGWFSNTLDFIACFPQKNVIYFHQFQAALFASKGGVR